jgi:23S rRNA (uracil1939-C5)-methyltransferase
MHLAREAQMEGHAAIVRRALPEALANTPIVTHAAPRALGYRVRARVHVAVRARAVDVGMFGRRSHDPVAVETCAVLDPALERARRMLAALLAGARGRGEAQLSLGQPEPAGTPAAARLAVVDLHWTGELGGEVFARLERAVAGRVLAGARVFEGGNVKKPATIGHPTPWIRGADDAPLRLGAGGFSQASEEGNAMLVRRAAALAEELAPAHGRRPVVELYAGAGNMTVLLARRFEVVAIEHDREACDAARDNIAARGLSARVVEKDAAAYAAVGIGGSPALVVLDPPRTGAKEVARALADKPVPAVLYVSCDPATLGRDLATLAPAYTLAALETFEMFPQTSHVETVAALVRRPRGSR